MSSLIIKIVLFQTAWFGCVFLAADFPTIAFIPMLLWSLFALVISPFKKLDIQLLLLITPIGFIVDSCLIQSSILLIDGPFSPLWLVSMWMGFALTVHWAYQKLEGSIAVLSVLGFIAGSLSYRAGASIGGIVVAEPHLSSFFVIGGCWAILFPIFVRFARVRRIGAMGDIV